jgi:hypothetical protein
MYFPHLRSLLNILTYSGLMSSPLYSASSCQKILDETAPLLALYHSSLPDLKRLQVLIDEHFQDNSTGNDFRSYCCFGLPGKPVSLQLFNELCILPVTNYCVQLAQDDLSGSIAPSFMDPDQKNKYLVDFAVTASNNIIHIFQQIVKYHSRSEEILGFIPADGIPLTWSLQIVGAISNKNNNSSPSLPPLSVLRERILLCVDCAFQARLSNNKLKFFCKETGAMWQKTIDDVVDAQAIYLQAGSEFKDLLENLLVETGKTFDELAGVKPSQRYPHVEALVRDGFERSTQKGMESVDLHLEDGSLGGTVLAMHNEGFFSVEWIAAYLVDTDQNHFMVDDRALKKKNKERFLRIFSVHHNYSNPTWMQFGKKSGVYLYLSQRASAAEEGWLKIVSFVVNLLIDDINKRLDSETGSRYQLEQVLFDTGVASVADPSHGSFAKHQDGFPGLVSASIKGFSRFLLVVPTLAFQNHCSANATISWYRMGETNGPPLASFIHDFLLHHWQLPGVNFHFQHDVSFRCQKLKLFVA